MAGFGTLMFLVALIGLFMTRKSSQYMYKHKWTLWVMGLMTFTPFIANTCGWLITELGRAPWTVYGMYTIMQSVSPNVSVASLLISNIVYFCLFLTLAIVLIGLIVRFLRNNPTDDIDYGYSAKVDPFAKEAF